MAKKPPSQTGSKWKHGRVMINIRDKEFKAALKNITVDAVTKTTEAVTQEARDTAPRITSELAQGITGDVQITKYGTKVVGAVVTHTDEDKRMGYGGFVALGTEDTQPNPWMENALKKHLPKLQGNMENKL